MDADILLQSLSKYNFKLSSTGRLSCMFLEQGIDNFLEASKYIHLLPYRRNKLNNDLAIVLTEHCGTCSTKHALLKAVAEENERNEVRFILGMYRMNERNTPQVKEVLREHHLDYLPEAHTYLKIHGAIFDFTKPDFGIQYFLEDLVFELEITAKDIGDYKNNLHKEYLSNWLLNAGTKGLSLEDLWNIRELCIQQISK